MAERKTYDQINSIYLASPAMTTSIAQHAAIGRLEGRERVDAIFNLEQSVSTRQEEYLLENQIKIIEFTVNNNAVLYRVTDIDDQVYSVQSEDRTSAERIIGRQRAESNAQQTGEMPPGSQRTATQRPPRSERQNQRTPAEDRPPRTEEESLNDFSIPFKYKKTTEDGAVVEASWRYKFTLPVKRTPGENDSEGKLIDLDNVKPIKDQSTSLLIAMVKNFLGLGAPQEVTSNFDVTFENALVRFQDQNRDLISELGYYSEDPNQLDLRVPILASTLRVESDQIVPTEYLSERGTIGVPTYLAMLRKGFFRSADRFLQNPQIQQAFTSAKSPDDVFSAFEKKAEIQEPPQKGTKFINYTYLSEITKRMRPNGLTNDDKISLFRKAVVDVFEYYNKDKMWFIEDDEDSWPSYKALITAQGGNPDEKSYYTEKEIREEIGRIERRYNVTIAKKIPRNFDFDEASRRAGDAGYGPDGRRFKVAGGPGVDVLYLQNLKTNTPNVNFARIKSIHSPSARPNSVYTMSIQIKKDMFEDITNSSARIPGSKVVDLSSVAGITAAAEDAMELYDKGKEAWGKYKEYEGELKQFLGEVGELSQDDVERLVGNWAEAQKRKATDWAKQQGKNIWDQALSRDNETYDDLYRDALAAEQLKNRQSLEKPKVVVYDLKDIGTKFKDIIVEMKNHHPKLLEFEEKNIEDPDIPVFSPKVSLEVERQRLKLLENALKEFCSLNEVDLNKKEGFLRVTFTPVVKSIPRMTSKPSDDPNADVPMESKMVPTEVGFKIYKIEYYLNPGIQPRALSVGETNLSRSPWNYPTTVAYFMQLNDIYETIGTRKDLCEELLAGPGATIFLAKYHYPSVRINYKKDRDDEALMTLKIGFDDRTLIKAIDRIEQNAQIISDNFKALMDTSFSSGQLEVHVFPPIFADFDKFRCDLDLLYEDFFNQWSFNHLMCDFLRCFPSFGPWSWDFSWSLPEIPKLPSFDPLQFILPKIREIIGAFIQNFLCKLIKQILGELAAPNCADLLQYGAAGIAMLIELNKDNPYASPKEKADLMKKTGDTLEEMGIPADSIAGDNEEVIASFLGNISLVLTPKELCDLLQGQATDEIALIVLKVIQAEKESKLTEILNDIAQVKEFFRVLGTSIDPHLCDRIREIGAIPLSTSLCDDDEQSAREIAESHTTTPEELAEELRRVAEKKEVFDDLLKNNGFGGLVPDSMSPEATKESGLPGPYNNPLHDQKSKEIISTTLQGVRTVYQMEIKTLVEKLLSEDTSLPVKGDPEFKGIKHAKFVYYTAQIENMARDNESLSSFKPIVAIQPIGGGTSSLFGIQRIVRLLPWYIDLNLPYEEMAYFVVPSLNEDNWIKPDNPEYFSFLEEMVEYVTEYLSENTIVKVNSETTLRKILRQDTSSVSRIFPGGPRFDRRLHVRNLTNLEKALEEQEIQIVDANTNVSSFFSVGYSELPFYDDRVKDCYQFSYRIDSGQSEPVYVQKIYKNPVPQEYIDLRKQHPDVRSDRHRDKLLRPGGFGAMMTDAFKTLSEFKSQQNTLDVYADGLDNIIPKLQGYVDDLDREQIEQLFVDANEELGGGLGGLIVGLLIAALGAGSSIETLTKVSPLYSSISDSMNYEISTTTTRSKYFELSELLNLETELSTEFIKGKENDGRPCFIKNPRFLSIDKISERFGKIYEKYANKPEHEPLNEDFQGPGPFEEGFVEALFKLYVDIFCLELSFKSLYMFSQYGSGNIFKEPFVVDYVTEMIMVEFFDLALSAREMDAILDHFKRITGVNDRREALRLMILRSLEDQESTKDIIEKIHGSNFSSYKEKFYNDLVNNTKAVPSMEDAPRLTPNTFDAGKTYKLAPPLFNLYDKYAFDGYEKELIQKKINSGHFWIEKFYRLKEPDQLRERLQGIYNVLGLGQIGSPAGTNFALSVEDIVRGSYDEYFSPKELTEFLYGARQADNPGTIQSVDSADEYEFAKIVYLCFLYDFYQTIRTDSNARLKYSKAFNLMILLGMSDKGEDFSFIYPGSRGPSRYNQDPSPLRRIANTGGVTPAGPRDRDFPFDFDYRRFKETISKEELVERLKFLYENVTQKYNETPENDRVLVDPDTYANMQALNAVGQFGAEFNAGFFGSNGIRTQNPAGLGLYYDILPAETYNNAYSDLDRNTNGRPASESRLVGRDDLYPYKFEFFLFLEKLLDPGHQFIRNISTPTDRRMEIIIECLTNFTEMCMNWPMNDLDVPINSERFGLEEVGNSFAPFLREDENLLDSTVVSDLLEDLRNKGPGMAIKYEGWRNEYPSTFNSVDIANEDLSFMDYDSSFDAPTFDDLENSLKYRITVADRTERRTPAYRQGDGTNLQDRILNLYIAKAIRNQYTARIGNSLNRTGITKLGFFDTKGITARFGLQSGDENRLYAEQVKLKNYINENLEIGMRLMSGFKAIRKDNAVSGRPDTDLGDTHVKTEIKPSQIFGDIVMNQNSNFIGLRSDENLFTKKRAFLGYVDEFDISDSEGLLNEKSVFFQKANTILVNISAEGTFEQQNISNITSYDQLQPIIKDNVVYSIPVDECTKKVNCLEDFFEEYMTDDTDANYTEEAKKMLSRGFPTNLIRHDHLQNFLDVKMFEKYEDAIYKKLLSLEKRDNRGVRRIKNPTSAESQSDKMAPHRLLFDLYFPLDRYVAAHFLQNIEVMDMDREQTGEILPATKLLLLSLLDQVLNRKDINVSMGMMIESSGEAGGIKAKISNLMIMLLEMIEEMTKVAMRVAIRTTVRYVDPAYRDMRKGYLDKPCGMKTGLKPGLIGPAKYKNNDGERNWRNIRNGFASVKGCQVYVPLQRYAEDMVSSLAYAIDSPRSAIQNIKTITGYFRNTISGKRQRYGFPTTPFTGWALSIGEVPSEKHSTLKKQNKCADRNCEPDKKSEQPIGLCEDDQEN